MALPIPKEFIDLKSAREKPANTFINVIGSVIDIQPSMKASSGEWTMSFKLLDLRLRDDAFDYQGATVRCFDRYKDKLPMVQKLGDVVLMRSVKRTDYQGAPILVSNQWKTTTLVFPTASIPDPAYAVQYMGSDRMNARGAPNQVAKLTAEEQRYVILLHHRLLDHVSALPPLQPPPAPSTTFNGVSAAPSKAQQGASAFFGAKFKLVKDVEHRHFADVVVQVVKIFHGPNKVELYVTDYTENKNVWLYTPPEEESEKERLSDGDPYNYTNFTKREWKGPWGQRVLKVNVMEPHATFARSHVSEGQTVLLKNMKVKAMDGAKLEGDLWRDDISRERINIKMMSQAALQTREFDALQLRKGKYWAERERMEVEQEAKKEEASKQEANAPVAAKSKAQKKAEKQREKKREKQRVMERRKDEAVQQNEAVLATYTAGNECNKHIRAQNDGHPIMTVRDILDPDDVRHTFVDSEGDVHRAPFVNLVYKAKLRVVGYEPSDIRDFAKPAWPTDDNRPIPVDYDYGPNPDYEWYFVLICEDATTPSATKTKKEQMKVHVPHENAQHLFGNDMPDPADLRAKPRLLAKLKEKLCILWGNLEEKSKEEPLKNLPFVCCIEEWGCELEDHDDHSILQESDLGWERLHGICRTIIL